MMAWYRIQTLKSLLKRMSHYHNAEKEEIDLLFFQINLHGQMLNVETVCTFPTHEFIFEL